MKTVCDCHVHLYPHYDLPDAFTAAACNLAAFRPQYKALCLTERADCSFFQQISQGQLTDKLADWRVDHTPDDTCLMLSHQQHGELFLFAGRQVATAERIELLSLFTDTRIPDGTPFQKAREITIDHGGVPVLNWAMGKWMFGRRTIVENILQNATPESLAICDTSMRPTIWPEPQLMRLGVERGLTILAGSDPLPLPGEEQLIGSYALGSSHPIDRDNPLASVTRMFRDPASTQRLGNRSGVTAAVQRNWALARANS